MFGERRSVPLWQRRRPKFLKLERALVPEATNRTMEHRMEHRTDSERAVIGQRAARRRIAQALARSGREG